MEQRLHMKNAKLQILEEYLYNLKVENFLSTKQKA